MREENESSGVFREREREREREKRCVYHLAVLRMGLILSFHDNLIVSESSGDSRVSMWRDNVIHTPLPFAYILDRKPQLW